MLGEYTTKQRTYMTLGTSYTEKKTLIKRFLVHKQTPLDRFWRERMGRKLWWKLCQCQEQ